MPLSLVRERRDEVAAVEHSLHGVRGQGIASSKESHEPGAARWRAQGLGDVDPQPSAGLGHRPRRGHLPEGETQRLERVGHHLVVADGQIDVVPLVALLWDREQGGDGPTLDDEKIVVGQAPRDVLGPPKMRLDPPPELHEAHYLRIR